VEEEAQEERTNPRLNKRELAEFQKNRELLSLAEARLDARAKEEDRDGFFMQEAGDVSKSAALNKRTKDRDNRSDFHLWEDEQARKAKTTAGLPERQRVNLDDYEYVFDESHKINFTSGGTLAGTIKPMTQEQKVFQERLQAAEAEAASIQESRKKLPMYQYRQQLVDAVRNYQSIIVSSD